MVFLGVWNTINVQRNSFKMLGLTTSVNCNLTFSNLSDSGSVLSSNAVKLYLLTLFLFGCSCIVMQLIGHASYFFMSRSTVRCVLHLVHV